MNSLANDVFLVYRILLGYEEALWPKKLDISHAIQTLTNDCQILVLSHLPNNYFTNDIFFFRTQLIKPHFFSLFQPGSFLTYIHIYLENS